MENFTDNNARPSADNPQPTFVRNIPNIHLLPFNLPDIPHSEHHPKDYGDADTHLPSGIPINELNITPARPLLPIKPISKHNARKLLNLDNNPPQNINGGQYLINLAQLNEQLDHLARTNPAQSATPNEQLLSLRQIKDNLQQLRNNQLRLDANIAINNDYHQKQLQRLSQLLNNPEGHANLANHYIPTNPIDIYNLLTIIKTLSDQPNWQESHGFQEDNNLPLLAQRAQTALIAAQTAAAFLAADPNNTNKQNAFRNACRDLPPIIRDYTKLFRNNPLLSDTDYDTLTIPRLPLPTN